MEFMGLDFDPAKNAGIRGKETLLSKEGSRVKVMTIPTNEELVIAEHTHRIAAIGK
jgi:acetate kinase